MDRAILPAVLVATLLLVVLAILFPGTRQPPADRQALLPWTVSLDPQGRPTVLGVTLGLTTLGELEQRLGEEAKLQLFVRDGEPATVEGFFAEVRSGGLRAQIVVTLVADRKQLEGIYQRGVRISRAGSGSSQVKLATSDGEWARVTPVATLTYIPHSRSLDEGVLIDRFGPPQRRLQESNGTHHLLYPALGVDIVLPPEGRVVIQYLPPSRFSEVVDPLES